MKKRKDKGLYAYLDKRTTPQSTEVEIAACRAEWIRLSKAKWRKDKRATVKSLTLSFTPEEYKTITSAAKKHVRSRTAFCKGAVFAYLNRIYLIADRVTVRQAQQAIEMTFNAVMEALQENAIPAGVGKVVLAKIFELERLLVATLCHPVLLTDAVAKATKEHPELRDELAKIIQA